MFTSFYLKISALGKNRKWHSWDQQQNISLLVPGLPSNPALSTNFPVFPSSALHLCPLTHLSGSLLSSTPNFSLAGIIPGFKHPDLQSQACHCCSVTPVHASKSHTSTGDQLHTSPPAKFRVATGGDQKLCSVPTEQWHSWGSSMGTTPRN